MGLIITFYLVIFQRRVLDGGGKGKVKIGLAGVVQIHPGVRIARQQRQNQWAQGGRKLRISNG